MAIAGTDYSSFGAGTNLEERDVIKEDHEIRFSAVAGCNFGNLPDRLWYRCHAYYCPF